MKVAALTAPQLAAIRGQLNAIDAQFATPATRVGRNVPAHLRPPQTYSPGARGWSVQATYYPQLTGATVVTLTGVGHAGLAPPQRRLFVDLPNDAQGNPVYPPGFNEGQVVAGAVPVVSQVLEKPSRR